MQLSRNSSCRLGGAVAHKGLAAAPAPLLVRWFLKRVRRGALRAALVRRRRGDFRPALRTAFTGLKTKGLAGTRFRHGAGRTVFHGFPFERRANRCGTLHALV